MTENEKKALSSVFSAVNKALTVADESTIMAMTYVFRRWLCPHVRRHESGGNRCPGSAFLRKSEPKEHFCAQAAADAQAQETVAAEAQAQPGQGQITQEAVAAQAAQETAQVAQPQAAQKAEAQAQPTEARRPDVVQETAEQLAQSAPMVQKTERAPEQISLDDAVAKTLADNGFPDRTQQTQIPGQAAQETTQADQTVQTQQPEAETQQSVAYETPAQEEGNAEQPPTGQQSQQSEQMLSQDQISNPKSGRNSEAHPARV